MFSVEQKRAISDGVQKLLRDTAHPELPDDEITFQLQVVGATAMSWATIQNNEAVPNPDVNPYNEQQAQAGKG